MENSNSKYLLPDLSSGSRRCKQDITEREVTDFAIDLILPTLPECGPYTEYVIKPLIQDFTSSCWELASDHVMSQDFSIIIDE